MSGSSLDGLDIAYCIIEEVAGSWSFQIEHALCIPFDAHWTHTLQKATELSAKDLMITHCAFGKWMGQAINNFIEAHQLHHKVHLIASHGHTVYHEPQQGMTLQIGDGASIAATTHLPVVSDLRNMDIALGGQGAPIVPIGEKLFWNDYTYFLNIGGISNITIKQEDKHIAYDVCPANKVLNLLANVLNKPFDEHGEIAATGSIISELLKELNEQEYYARPYPKSLANEFGSDTLLNLIQQYPNNINDKLRTFVEHIASQIAAAVPQNYREDHKMLVTGGGALNSFLIKTIREKLAPLQVEVPDEKLIQYKEALVMALIGVLRWREEDNVLSSVSGASSNSIGGALWMGA